MAVDRERAKSIFVDACELAGEADTVAFVKQACGADTELQAEVESLLTAHRSAGQFLNSPDVGSLEIVRYEVGPYKILSLLGEGGFGSVFLAEQQRPVRRRVALKIIKLGMDTRQVISRFEVEQQAMALMEHPNIAKVFDAGVTSAGRPYFVMELVLGKSITEFCDAQCLTIRERIELFATVCRAIQHAHDKGVIHRDIKPSNILVTIVDEAPVPKIIDFGIAKAMAGDLADKTLITQSQQFLGTPHYISPEQALMTGGSVDARSDVYSLGVLLYELLTGTTPFNSADFNRAAPGDVQRIICEVDPPEPSIRLQKSPDVATVSARRRTDLRRLRHTVCGELDWVVMKCLEKQPVRRYQSAGDIADDLARYLDDKPVLARPVWLMSRLTKTMRRHRIAFAFAAVAVLALVIGIATGMVTRNAPGVANIPGPSSKDTQAEVPLSQPIVLSKSTDLLPLIDATRDAIDGHWQIRDGALHASGGETFNRLQIQHRPTGEYDYVVHFTVESGDGPVIQICPTSASNLLWQVAWDGYGFEGGVGLPGGKRPLLQKDVEYEGVVKVRNDRIQAYLNGKLIAAFERSDQRFSLHDSKWALPDEDSFGLAIWNSSVRFSKVEICEFSTAKGD